jgi:hypothetical protein
MEKAIKTFILTGTHKPETKRFPFIQCVPWLQTFWQANAPAPGKHPWFDRMLIEPTPR